ncbi:MAG TPA: cytochrome ubiquinol oxidase subunit I [Ktedonobacteraceae bacterium]
MDAVTLARLQFGTTIVYHYLFVPLTLGLALLIAIMETLYVWSGDVTYKRMTQFWGRLFLINFTLGVITGIVQEFQFGMNWSVYSRFVGDVFGSPLAIEALAAFFLESTFLGIWLFGWEQLHKGVHLGAIWLVVLSSYLSAFWILIANSFMQEPVGYTIHNGRAEMTSFFALLSNPTLWVEFPHVVAAGIVTGAFFVVGISAYHLIKKHKDLELFQRAMKIGLITAFIGSIAVIYVGDLQGKQLAQSQPMKTAAAEALWNTEDPASLSLFAIIDEQHHTNTLNVSVPYALSFLVHDSLHGQVQGINQLEKQYEKTYGPGNYIPDVTVAYWTFRLMVGAGSLMALLACAGLFFLLRKRLERQRWFLWILVLAIAFPYLANVCGWVLTEMGRQPWLVFGLLTTADGISPTVSPGLVLFTLIGFILLYGVLAVVDATLLFKYAKADSEPIDAEAGKEDEVLNVTF